MKWMPNPSYLDGSSVKYRATWDRFEFLIIRSTAGLWLFRRQIGEAQSHLLYVARSDKDAEEAEPLILKDIDDFLMENLL